MQPQINEILAAGRWQKDSKTVKKSIAVNLSRKSSKRQSAEEIYGELALEAYEAGRKKFDSFI
jgi:hypothetical protein